MISKRYLLQDSLTIKICVILFIGFIAIAGSIVLIKYNKWRNKKEVDTNQETFMST